MPFPSDDASYGNETVRRLARLAPHFRHDHATHRYLAHHAPNAEWIDAEVKPHLALRSPGELLCINPHVLVSFAGGGKHGKL